MVPQLAVNEVVVIDDAEVAIGVGGVKIDMISIAALAELI